MLLTAFVIAFGVVKAVLNFVAGRLSERLGRKHVLMLGWVIALPILKGGITAWKQYDGPLTRPGLSPWPGNRPRLRLPSHVGAGSRNLQVGTGQAR